MFATFGIMAEDRDGGTAPGGTLPNGMPFTESLKSRHVDGGFVGRWLVLDNRVLVGSRVVHAAISGSAVRTHARVQRAQHMVR